MKCSLASLTFLERSLVFPILLFSSVSWHCSVRRAFLSLFAVLWNSIQTAQLEKNPPSMWESWVWSLGWEDALEKGKATHSSVLVWRIPRSVYSAWGRRVGQDCMPFTFTFPFLFAFHFSSFLSYLYSLLIQPLCLFAFLFLGNVFDHHLLCNVADLHP